MARDLLRLSGLEPGRDIECHGRWGRESFTSRETTSAEVAEREGELDLLRRGGGGISWAGGGTPRGGVAGRWSHSGAGRRRGVDATRCRAVRRARRGAGGRTCR